MVKPDISELEALAALKFQLPRAVIWLERRRQDVGVKLAGIRDEVELRMLQGRAQELDYVLDQIQQATENLTKRKAP